MPIQRHQPQQLLVKILILIKILNKQQHNHPASQLAVELLASQDIISTTPTNLAYNVMHLASLVLNNLPTAHLVTLSTT
jgi:hypothetical protein